MRTPLVFVKVARHVGGVTIFERLADVSGDEPRLIVNQNRADAVIIERENGGRICGGGCVHGVAGFSCKPVDLAYPTNVISALVRAISLETS